jgi:hypothetical protein
MDLADATGRTGFDAALKALEELESSVVESVQIGVSPIGIAPGSPIDVIEDDGLPMAMAAAAALTAGSSISTEIEDLEAALNASTAQIAMAPVNPALSFAPSTTPYMSPHVSAVPAAVAAPAVEAIPAKPSRLRFLPIAAACLGVIASLLSVIGLIVASRTVAGASLVVADARERQQQLVQVGMLLHDLDAIRARQIELLQRQQAAAVAAPLTVDQFNATMDNMQEQFGKHGPDAEIMIAIHQSENEVNQHLNEVSLQMKRIEAMIGSGRSSLPRGQ